MKKSQLEKAIESLEADRAVLDLAIAKLKAQMMLGERKPRVRRGPKAVESKVSA